MAKKYGEQCQAWFSVFVGCVERSTERIAKAIAFKPLPPEPMTIHVLTSNYILFHVDA